MNAARLDAATEAVEAVLASALRGSGAGRFDARELARAAVEAADKVSWLHNPWSMNCGRRVEGEPYRDGERCYVCEPEARSV